MTVWPFATPISLYPELSEAPRQLARQLQEKWGPRRRLEDVDICSAHHYGCHLELSDYGTAAVDVALTNAACGTPSNGMEKHGYGSGTSLCWDINYHKSRDGALIGANPYTTDSVITAVAEHACGAPQHQQHTHVRVQDRQYSSTPVWCSPHRASLQGHAASGHQYDMFVLGLIHPKRNHLGFVWLVCLPHSRLYGPSPSFAT